MGGLGAGDEIAVDADVAAVFDDDRAAEGGKRGAGFGERGAVGELVFQGVGMKPEAAKCGQLGSGGVDAAVLALAGSRRVE